MWQYNERANFGVILARIIALYVWSYTKVEHWAVVLAASDRAAISSY